MERKKQEKKRNRKDEQFWLGEKETVLLTTILYFVDNLILIYMISFV